MGLIFDLDQTIIDSSLAESYRSARNWSAVYSTIGNFTVYEGIVDILGDAKAKGIKICIVTSSPSTYCNRVLSHFNIPHDYTVCYHDTTRRKPHPEPILKGLQYLNLPANKVLSFGDRDIDIVASNAAKVASVACTWGCSDVQTLKAAKPSYIVNSPREIYDLIKMVY
ncbi:HAD family hydrolase [Chitinophaga sancti]|uniref:phosphoglycolate phosphatase n=1 Tax=Chitinophaga sancti TaxID=1004 RepID=A0A1K1SIA7_9BACT|nr:HAD family hydrolase [Chitinophaga sancti]WQD61777.1 HAD family hydrolase [Chitinophaga sancti]WQG92654.1 HAD family hydrolase [Chitinophaga sancti]SFW84046.1 phosphoglycolate phosphatase [Chitinophaga sancti]